MLLIADCTSDMKKLDTHNKVLLKRVPEHQGIKDKKVHDMVRKVTQYILDPSYDAERTILKQWLVKKHRVLDEPLIISCALVHD